MLHSRKNIIFAAAFAAIFLVFNVGLPIALYVCPMMADQQCKCTCSQTSEAGPSITYVHTPCCTSSLVADRNTVPFLESQTFDAAQYESAPLLMPCDFLSSRFPLQPSLALNTDTGPPPSDVPRYILSSSLLI
jgi:hypothetical protein